MRQSIRSWSWSSASWASPCILSGFVLVALADSGWVFPKQEDWRLDEFALDPLPAHCPYYIHGFRRGRCTADNERLHKKLAEEAASWKPAATTGREGEGELEGKEEHRFVLGHTVEEADLELVEEGSPLVLQDVVTGGFLSLDADNRLAVLRGDQGSFGRVPDDPLNSSSRSPLKRVLADQAWELLHAIGHVHSQPEVSSRGVPPSTIILLRHISSRKYLCTEDRPLASEEDHSTRSHLVLRTAETDACMWTRSSASDDVRMGDAAHLRSLRGFGLQVERAGQQWRFYFALELNRPPRKVESIVTAGRERCDALGERCAGFAAPIDDSYLPFELQLQGSEIICPRKDSQASAKDEEYDLVFHHRWNFYRKPKDRASSQELPPACDVERRFWGHLITPGSARPQRMCIFVDCSSEEEQQAAKETWANLRNLRQQSGKVRDVSKWMRVNFMRCAERTKQGRLLSQGVVRWVFEAFSQLKPEGNQPGEGNCDWIVYVPSQSYVDLMALWEHLSCYPSGAEFWWLATEMGRDKPPTHLWPWSQHPLGLHAVSRPAMPLATYTLRDGVCTLSLAEKRGAEKHFVSWKASCCRSFQGNLCFEEEDLFDFCCRAVRIGEEVLPPLTYRPASIRFRALRRVLEAHNALLTSFMQLPTLAKRFHNLDVFTGPLAHIDENYVLPLPSLTSSTSSSSSSGNNNTWHLDLVALWNISRLRLSPSSVHAGHEPGCIMQVHPLDTSQLRLLHELQYRGASQTSSCAPQAVLDQERHSKKSLDTLVRCGSWWMALQLGRAQWNPEIHPSLCDPFVPARNQEMLNISKSLMQRGSPSDIVQSLLATTCCRLPQEWQSDLSISESLSDPQPTLWNVSMRQELLRTCFDHIFTPGRCCRDASFQSVDADSSRSIDDVPKKPTNTPQSLMLVGLPRSGTTWFSHVLGAAYDLKEGTRLVPKACRWRFHRRWLVLLRKGVRRGALVKKEFMQQLWYQSLAICPSARRLSLQMHPARGLFVHEFFVPGQYFRWEQLEQLKSSRIDTGFGTSKTFTNNTQLFANALYKVRAIMGASFYTGYHNMLRERVPEGAVDELVQEAWNLSGFRFTKEVQMHFRAAEFSKHFRVFAIFRHRHYTFPSSAPQIFLSLYQSLHLNDYVDPFHRAIRHLVLNLVETEFDKIVLAHTVATLFGIRTLRKLGAPILRWEDLVLLAGGTSSSSMAAENGRRGIAEVVETQLGPLFGVTLPLLLEVLCTAMQPGSWGIGVADQDLRRKFTESKSHSDFDALSAEEWLDMREKRYRSFPGAEQTEAKVRVLLKYAEELDQDDDAARWIL